MYRFKYRGARYSVDLPVELLISCATLPGRCTEISQDGLKIELAEPVACDSLGVLLISHQGRRHEFSVRAVHTRARSGGWEFLHSTEADKEAVAELVASVAKPAAKPRLGPVLLRNC